jgi:hypothetical protein
MMNAKLEATSLLKTRGTRQLAYSAQPARATGIWGSGRVVYATDDGWVGVCLDGETRVDEYPAEQLAIEVAS